MFAQQMKAYEDILFNADFRKKFIENPHAALLEAGLSEEEADRLSQNINPVGVKWDGRIRLIRIVSTLTHAYPTTHLILCGIMGEMEIYEQYMSSSHYTDRQPMPHYPFPHPGMLYEGFYQFVMEKIETGEIQISFLKDVLEYEKNRFSYKLVASESGGYSEAGDGKQEDPTDSDWTPRVNPFVYVHRFGYHIEDIRKALTRFKTPMPYNFVLQFVNDVKKDTMVVFKVENGNLYEYNLPVAYEEVFRMSNGVNQVSDIVNFMNETMSEAELYSFLKFASNKKLLISP